MEANSYVRVDRMIWFPLPLSPLTYPDPCPHPTSEFQTIPAPLSDRPVPTSLHPSSVPSVSLTIAGQFIVDDTDFVEVDLGDEEAAQPPNSFLKTLLSRMANVFRRVKNLFKKDL
ncbi:uncharacterized protein [Haliotis asinina]|uniref:uncharacterized protein n=1 Tax=Haliotis asinina TaxID=109174 RepID=UPI003531F7EC